MTFDAGLDIFSCPEEADRPRSIARTSCPLETIQRRDMNVLVGIFIGLLFLSAFLLSLAFSFSSAAQTFAHEVMNPPASVIGATITSPDSLPGIEADRTFHLSDDSTTVRRE